MQISALFRGRIGRAHFAYTVLALFVAMVLVSIVAAALGDGALGLVWSLVSMAFYVVATVVGLGISIRRYHDLGWSGWLVLLGFIPLVNLVMLLIQLFKAGTPGPNAYGAPLDRSLPLLDALMNKEAAVVPATSPAPVDPAPSGQGNDPAAPVA